MYRLPCRFYEFSSFRVDTAERRLWRDGKLVPLTPKVFDILLALVENSGHTLEKEELMERVWADTFVEEGNLNRNISTLRKALGDDGRRQRFIKTIPKLGYRFTADVREVLEDEEELLVEDKTRYQLKVSEEIQEEEKRLRFSNIGLIISVIAVLLIAVAGTWMWNQTRQNEMRPLVSEAEKSEALELYKQGRALWQTRDGKDLHKATLLLEQSVQKNPKFALAHAALADAYAFDYRNWKMAEKEAREAIRLNSNLGEPHATIGFIKMFWEWKFQEAEMEFKQAVKLSPNYATGHQWYAINLHAIGNSGHAALVEMKKALELEPDSVSINADMCQTLYFLRRYDEAITQCKKTLAMDNKSHNAHQYLYEIYNVRGMYDEAVDIYFRLEEITVSPSPTDFRKELRQAYSKGGIRDFWKKRAEFVSNPTTYYYRKAQHYALLGEKDEAFFQLQKSYETQSFNFYLFLADPVFDGLRTDQRHKDLSGLLLSPKNKNNE